jgi:3-oxoacyl-[acyl-carrier protein] reductase
MTLLDGQVAVVTGGSRGLGFAIAQRFVAEGARVVLGDLDESALEDAAERLGGSDVAHATRCDVRSPSDVRALVAAATERFGTLDVMVNNAGITRDATIRKMTEEQFNDVVDVHLRGAWHGVREAAAVMRQRQRGAIINMSSISGKVGLPGQTNYSAAKAGINGLTKAAAKELGRHGVRVNAIAPGLIRTAMTEALPREIWEQKLADIPLGRAGEPHDVGNVALFLASEQSSYITGTVIEVSGGRHM